MVNKHMKRSQPQSTGKFTLKQLDVTAHIRMATIKKIQY